MSLTEKLVGMLGTKHEAFGVWGVAIVFAAIALLIGLEVVLGRAIRRAVSSLFKRSPIDRNDANGTGGR